MQKIYLALILAALLATYGCDKNEKTEDFDSSRLQLYGTLKDLNNPQRMPTLDLPGKHILDSYRELSAQQLLNRKLTVRPDRLPWGSSFFPTWFGGVSGRWQDNKLRLVFRSVFGTFPHSPFDAELLLDKAQKGDARAQLKAYGLAPTEKYDYALGDYTARSTRDEAVIRGHNTPQMLLKVPFWTGYCNGMALAAIRYAEPFREVEVVNPDGYHVRFHPNDIKALLGLAHSHASMTHWQVGTRCDKYTTSSPECNDINPASLVLVLANRIGIAREPVIVDQNPLAPVINNPVRSAEITVLRPPYPANSISGVASLIDVKIDLEVASTLMSDAAADVRDDGDGQFKRIEGGNLRLSYEATLALDSDTKLIGGRWTGRKLSGPDFVWGARKNAPDDIAILDHLEANPQIRYSVLDALHTKSVSTGRETPSLDITEIIPNSETELFAYYTNDPRIRIHADRTIRILGRLGAEFANSADHMNCTAGADDVERPEDVPVINFQFKALNRHVKFLDFDLPADVNRQGTNRLKCYFYGMTPDGKFARLTQSETIIVYH